MYNIIEAIITGEILGEAMRSCMKSCVQKEKTEPPIVSLSDKNMMITFDEKDKENISLFDDFLETVPCEYTFDEIIFIVEGDKPVLFYILYTLTRMYETITVL